MYLVKEPHFYNKFGKHVPVSELDALDCVHALNDTEDLIDTFDLNASNLAELIAASERLQQIRNNLAALKGRVAQLEEEFNK